MSSKTPSANRITVSMRFHRVKIANQWLFVYKISFPSDLRLALFQVLIATCFLSLFEIPALGQKVQLIVLGTAQDAGFPQAGCRKNCCREAWENLQLRQKVSCLGLIDLETGQRWMFDCSPDFPDQLRILNQQISRLEKDSKPSKPNLIDGIFLTHAHIGHYTGLIHLGREVIGARKVSTFAMPRMKRFLESNGPWSQLVRLQNIEITELTSGVPIRVNERIVITPFQVPHRDEFSETVGFKIVGPQKTAIYLPDIDKWSRWNRSIEELISQSDVSFLDGTFFANGEIPGRDMALIPHPFVSESLAQFSALDENERNKVRFIHLNHTNPLLRKGSPARRQVTKAGMKVAFEGETIDL